MNSHKNHYKVCIVGRANVGKSTLFNRLISRRKSLVHNLPGVTRDRIEERVTWYFKKKPYQILLTDTGGFGGPVFQEAIEAQIHYALEYADAVLFVVDGSSGVTGADREIMQMIQRKGLKKPILGLVNKCDTTEHEDRVDEFYELGLENWLGISAEHDRGSESIRDFILELAEAENVIPLPEDQTEEVLEAVDMDETEDSPDEKSKKEEQYFKRIPRIAIVGKPNVGKSTLFNALLGENRAITSPIAGTTVDALDEEIEIDGHRFVIVDTAGIRRKSKTEQGIEVLSVVQARKSLERADIALLVLDGEEGINTQDEKISGLILDSGCGVILLCNKWDTQKRNQEFSKKDAETRIRKAMPFLSYAPVHFISAKEHEGLRKIAELVQKILESRKTHISTHDFSEWVRRKSEIHNPKNAKFYLCHQTSRRPPTFVCHVSDPKKIHFSLQRHLINEMRKGWGFEGNPIRLLFEKSKANRPKQKRLPSQSGRSYFGS
jgi:GTP-binding protein